MEATLDLKDLEKKCTTCDSGKMAGNCCKAGEECPCGSGQAVGVCHLKVSAPKNDDGDNSNGDTESK